MSLIDHLRADTLAPHLASLHPSAAMPDGVIDVRGDRLAGASRPTAMVGDTPAPLAFTSGNRVTLRVPEGAISGEVTLSMGDHRSNALALNVAVPLADNLHPIANPAVDIDGNLYATFSGSRGQDVPVSIFRIDRDYQVRPFVRGLANASGLAFGPDGYLYSSSRAEGTVYRIGNDGAMSQWAEGMGIATGLAFDDDGNLYVGDRQRHHLQAEHAGFGLRLCHAGTFRLGISPGLQRRRHAAGDRPHDQQQRGHPRHQP